MLPLALPSHDTYIGINGKTLPSRPRDQQTAIPPRNSRCSVPSGFFFFSFRLCVCDCGVGKRKRDKVSTFVCPYVSGWRRELAGRPAGSTDGAEACHGSADDGHILTWDPQLSGSHTSCSGLSRSPHLLLLHLFLLVLLYSTRTRTHSRPGSRPLSIPPPWKGGSRTSKHGQVGVHALPRVFPCARVCFPVRQA